MLQPHEEPRIFQPGDVFHQYVVRSFLGAGACGQVYAVAHRHTGRVFALKVGHLKDRGNAGKVARSLVEATAVYALEHPNIVRVLDLGCEDSGMVWQIMEFLDGNSIGQLLGRFGRLSPLYAIEIVLEVACGLQAAHEQQVIHRDVHPWNISLTARGRVVVLDFSLAKVIPSGLKTTAGSRGMGTWGYLPPEHFKRAPATPQFDVFALGTTLWQMLVGRHPLHEYLGNPMLLFQKQLEGEAESLVTAAGLPAYCDEALRGAMARDPRGRYEGMWPLVQALTALHERLSTDPAAPPAVWDPPAWERQHALGQDGRSQYRPPRSLPRGSPVPSVPSARIVVSPVVARPALAATIPMSVAPLPPPPAPAAAPVSGSGPAGRPEAAPATVRGRAPAVVARRRRWAVLAAVPALVALVAGVWMLVTGDAPAAATPIASGPRAPPSSAPVDPHGPPAPRAKR